MNIIVSTGFGHPRYEAMVSRLKAAVKGAGGDIFVLDAEVAAAMHAKAKYSFKPQAIELALDKYGWRNVERILWLDSSVVPDMSRMREIWEAIDDRGVLLFEDKGWTIGQWASDQCLAAMDVPRESVMKLPMGWAGAVGLRGRNPNVEMASKFYLAWLHYAKDGKAFDGPHTNTAAIPYLKSNLLPCDEPRSGFCSDDIRVYGHRHDQTVASILMWQFRIPLASWDTLFHYGGTNPVVLAANGEL